MQSSHNVFSDGFKSILVNIYKFTVIVWIMQHTKRLIFSNELLHVQFKNFMY